MLQEHVYKLVIWKPGLYFLVETMIRFTVHSTKASLSQNVPVIIMSPSALLWYYVYSNSYVHDRSFLLFRKIIPRKLPVLHQQVSGTSVVIVHNSLSGAIVLIARFFLTFTFYDLFSNFIEFFITSDIKNLILKIYKSCFKLTHGQLKFYSHPITNTSNLI